MAEIELSVMTGQCLGRRIESQNIVAREVAAWEKTRNQEKVKIRGAFTVSDARAKLIKIYPSIKS